MKVKAVLLALTLAAGVASAAAIAGGPPPGKGRDSSTSSSTGTTSTGSGKGKKTSACKRSIILKGSFGSAASDSFTMHVKKSNAHGRKYSDEAVTLMVDSKTKFRRRGPAELEDFKQGDWLNVQARRVCEDEASSSNPGTAEEKLLARRVVGKPSDEGSSGETDD